MGQSWEEAGSPGREGRLLVALGDLGGLLHTRGQASLHSDRGAVTLDPPATPRCPPPLWCPSQPLCGLLPPNTPAARVTS